MSIVMIFDTSPVHDPIDHTHINYISKTRGEPDCMVSHIILLIVSLIHYLGYTVVLEQERLNYFKKYINY